MNIEKLRTDLLAAVTEYVQNTGAWDDAMLSIDTTTGRVTLIEADEEDSLPDCVDVYEIMDFVEMTPEGTWIPDPEAVDRAVDEYM